MATTRIVALVSMLSVATLAGLATAKTPAPAANTPDPSLPQQIAIPTFDGRTLDGKPFSTASFAGRRIILLCFNPGIEQASAFAEALANVAPEQSRYNFAVAGVALGLDPSKSRKFADEHRLDFPIFDDSDGRITEKLGLGSPLVMIGVDASGRAGFTLGGVEHGSDVPVGAVEAKVREFLRLPAVAATADGKLEPRIPAPPFEAERLDGGKPVRLADAAGKPVVLVFFQPTCSHCQDALRFFRAELARIPEKTRPVLLGISGDGRASSVHATLAEKKLDYFPVLVDPTGEITQAYGAFAGVPDIVLIDSSGHIAYRRMGWNEARDPDVMRMRIAQLSGVTVPMLLVRDGFSGNDACAVCHPLQAATWSYTDHAFAFNDLVTRAADRDQKCVGCHVVGFGEKGGYAVAARDAHLENVGCETCHGRGGGHLDKRATAASASTPASTASAAMDLRAACERCHDPLHSLGFKYETFLPKVSHAAIAALTDTARASMVAGRDQPRDLLPMTSDIAGSSACKSCHEREYAVWSNSAHARSVASLRKDGKDSDPACVRCHVTGYGRPGGFPERERPKPDHDLARVGCESCHGAGSDHVKAGGKSPAGIVKLGDKCDSCVVLKICGSCHDDANDPQFRFNVPEKIDAQRHGAAREAVVSAH
jgi:peroxiredoxin